MKSLISALFGFAMLAGGAAAQPLSDPSWAMDRGNGWTAALGFNSVPKPDNKEAKEGPHSHTLLYVFKWKLKAECDEAMHGDDGEMVADVSSTILAAEADGGYLVKDVTFACVSVPPENKSIEFAPDRGI